MPEPEVQFAPESVEVLRAQFHSDLRYRRLFVAGGFNLADRQQCLLVIVHPEGGSFPIRAEAVYIKSDEPFAGVGLELIGLDASRLVELDAFVNQASESQASESQASESQASESQASESQALESQALESQASESQASESQASESQASESQAPNEKAPRNLYERIRKLGLREREIVARQGILSERVALERTFGSSVWEALLQNPQLSVPEVAHLARNGTLPVPLVATIVANGAWLASGEVRRALMSNPRVSGTHLDRVLKAMPRVELKQVAQASPFRTQVRAAAKKLIGE